jgi:hypothetical protein
MACYHPLQAFFYIREDGKKNVFFSNTMAEAFKRGEPCLGFQNLQVPCGKCMGCRLERSRQWAVRCLHEAELYDDNCFITLTFDDRHLKSECENGSLKKKHMQDFMKRLRKRFSDRKIRSFYCGEYGESLSRPHYHSILFNLDFDDKVYYKTVNGFKYYTSEVLSDLWKFGYSVIGDVTFESAAYVARYCTKKVNGKDADDYYQGRLPEFSQASLKPGIGREWFERFGYTDIFPLDECVVRGVKCKPPRYYDKRLELDNPVLFEQIKLRRAERGEDKACDNSYDRLLVKEKCQQARMKQLVRNLERS